MTRKELIQTYDSFDPTPAQIRKMRSALTERLPRERSSPREYSVRTSQKRHHPWLTVAACLVLLVILGGLSVLHFGADLGWQTAQRGDMQTERYSDPIYQAQAEWLRYLASRPSANEVEEVQLFAYPYADFYCYDEDMAEKLDEICLKYQLTLPSESIQVNNYPALMDILGVDGICREQSEVSHDHEDCGSGYSLDGCFFFAGETRMAETASAWNYPIRYTFSRIPKQIFHERILEMGLMEEYDLWEHTQDGVTLLLGLHLDRAMILADRGADLLLVTTEDNRVGDIVYGELEMDRAAMEDFAATFDFSCEFEMLGKNADDAAFDASDYDMVIQKYANAYSDGWTAEMYEINGMSRHAAVENEEDLLYYAIEDLDGNGIPELVICQGPFQDFCDIYTLDNGEVKNVMSIGDDTFRYLCQGGVVKDITPERGDFDKYAAFYRLKGDEFDIETTVYQVDGQWYIGKTAAASGPITAEKVQEILDSYPAAELALTQIPQPGTVNSVTGYASYDDILDRYQTALVENWDQEQCSQADICPRISGEAGTIGWCLLDVDSNGVEELVISDGAQLYDLYTLPPTNGRPIHLLTAWPDVYTLCEGNVIEQQQFFSGTKYWRYLTLSDTNLISLDGVLFYEYNQYSYGASDEDLQPITKDEAGEHIFAYRTAALDLTPFIPGQTMSTDAAMYEAVLSTYYLALEEDWNPGQCAQEGISLMVGYYGELYKNLGYALRDLDGNGVEELIITDGTNIFDLYTIIDDEEYGPLRLLTGMERITYTLKEGNVIFCQGSGGAAVSYYTFYRLEERNLVIQEAYLFDADTDPNSPWFFYDGENRGEPCGNFDAEAAISAYAPLNILFVPFV